MFNFCFKTLCFNKVCLKILFISRLKFHSFKMLLYNMIYPKSMSWLTVRNINWPNTNMYVENSGSWKKCYFKIVESFKRPQNLICRPEQCCSRAITAINDLYTMLIKRRDRIGNASHLQILTFSNRAKVFKPTSSKIGLMRVIFMYVDS